MKPKKDNSKAKTFIIYTPEYAKNLPGLKVYAIYPDYWGEGIREQRSFRDASGKTIKYNAKHNWREPVCLGYVKEQSEYWAEKAALIAGIVRPNMTFNPRAIQMKTKLSELTQHPIRRKPYAKGKQRPASK